MLVVVVAVVEEAGAVETERGGWEVGGTAEDEEEGEGVPESASVGKKKQKHNGLLHFFSFSRHLFVLRRIMIPFPNVLCIIEA